MPATTTWVFRLYQICLFSMIVITTIITIMGTRYRAERRSVALAWLGGALAEWSFFYALEMTVPGLPAKMLMGRLEYFGIVTAPVAFTTLSSTLFEPASAVNPCVA